MAKEILINVAETEECRVAVVEGGVLEELYVERASLSSHVGNIYKGKVLNVESAIQAAFIDFGTAKNGFLHISDLHPRYVGGRKDYVEPIGQRKALRERPPMQKSLRKGDELVVQVTKEGVNTKGPTLSTYLAIPGKYLVMMPWMRKMGISHKIEDEQERSRLHQLLSEIKFPEEMGFIARTAAQGVTKKEIQNDLKYLERLWKSIEKRIAKDKSPSEIYQESDLVIRTLRDVFTSDVDKIICDSPSVVKRIKDFLSVAMPRLKGKVLFYDEQLPLFHKYKIEEEIDKVQGREVGLKGGGSIVIEQTEALVAIDVNSGSYRRQQSAEQTAFKINVEAAKEIARQLRLRDLGGLIIIDFIDMRAAKHRQDVEKEFRNAVRDDRARTKILRISNFGIVEMTRQRMRPSLQLSTYLACPTCGGSGFIKSQESIAIEIMRMLNLAASKEHVRRIEFSVSPVVAGYLQNEKRSLINEIESEHGKRVVINAVANYAGEKHDMVCYNDRGSVVQL
jgi:ribonuclease E